jgi:hypothetical protein
LIRTLKNALALSMLLLVLGLGLAGASRADDYFAITRVDNEGRSVAAELVDLNGDRRTDLFVAALSGIPPEEERVLRVYLQGEDGKLPAKPDHLIPIPEWSAVYDVADVRPESPGVEIVLLRPEGVTILSLASPEGRRWDFVAPGPTAAGLADDERGFERYQIVFRDFGDEPWLIVPQIGQLTALTPTGEVRAQMAIPRRANYFIIPTTGLLSLESDFQVFVDMPKTTFGDVDGDGRVDVVSSTRHEIRVFLRAEDGSYPREPSRRLALRLVTPRDHIRGSGGVGCEARDIDGDGRLDLLITHAQGSIRDATSTTYLYLNHSGGWDLGKPDQVMGPRKTVGSNALFDLNRDGTRELIQAEISFSLLEFVELLLSQELDATLSVYGYEEGVGFGDKPRAKRRFSVPFSFDTFRLEGFVPSAEVDINGDGFLDFVASGGGEELEIYRGDDDSPFADRVGDQKLDTAGVIRFGDLDSDGLVDFVIFDPHNFDVPVRLGRNLGMLPGTPSGLTARPE